MAGSNKPEPQIIYEIGNLPSQIVLDRDEEVIGRSSDCSICVRSVMVSRRHAVFRRDRATESWTVSDDCSMNGVYVNSQRVDPSQPQVLRAEDIVSLGPPQRTNLVFRFVTDDPNCSVQGQRSIGGRAFLVMLGNRGSLKQCPAPKQTPTNDASPSADVMAVADTQESTSDRDNNNLSASQEPSRSASTTAAGSSRTGNPSGACSKKLRLSAGDNVVRRVETIMENELTCVICSELFVDATMLQCGHTFCSYCIVNWSKQKNCCPFCQEGITSATRSFVVDNIVEELVCFNPELKRFREELVRSRLGGASNRLESKDEDVCL